VDDIILARDSLEAISDIKAQLHNAFKIKDLKNLKYFLGLEITDKKGIHLCSNNELVDIFTKPLHRNIHRDMICKLGLMDIHDPA